MELLMAGGNYPVAEMRFPNEFLATVQAEVDATTSCPEKSRADFR
jgi:hypothetical protein